MRYLLVLFLRTICLFEGMVLWIYNLVGWVRTNESSHIELLLSTILVFSVGENNRLCCFFKILNSTNFLILFRTERVMSYKMQSSPHDFKSFLRIFQNTNDRSYFLNMKIKSPKTTRKVAFFIKFRGLGAKKKSSTTWEIFEIAPPPPP